MTRAAVVLALFACGRRTEELAPSPDQPAIARDAGAGDGGVAKRKLGEACAEGECAGGLRCVRWTTEGGEPHATCEVPCGPAPDYTCPAGTGCVHQGGGPSEVCLRR